MYFEVDVTLLRVVISFSSHKMATTHQDFHWDNRKWYTLHIWSLFSSPYWYFSCRFFFLILKIQKSFWTFPPIWARKKRRLTLWQLSPVSIFFCWTTIWSCYNLILYNRDYDIPYIFKALILSLWNYS